MQPKIIFIIIQVASIQFLCAQNRNILFEQALLYKKVNQVDKALSCFEMLLKSDSSNIQYLCNASIFYSKKGNEFADKQTRLNYFNKAYYLARKSLVISSNFPESHYCMALAMGRMNEFASTKTKISNAKEIKLHIDETLKLNPMHAGAYHLLGRWHRTMAGFNTLDKLLISSFYGGVPKGYSYDASVKAFRKAIAFEPFYKLHQYELAQTFFEMGKPIEALFWFKKALAISSKNKIDLLIDNHCKKALIELQ
ncbi:MAG TPA: hypothetical protein PK323_03505 [Bacteroidia bacterium]|nr:hypothetical protein [Bacteroidia bacterium]